MRRNPFSAIISWQQRAWQFILSGAEVSLTFENTKNLLPTEFNIVTISRKFYKNGESEYRLNDVTCRLKDITNLFMDTGVTSDSYSIIELGMVDDIIKDKENSRRRMLEQAAGISIYKTRKKEAKQKLDATEQDLNRIEDLLFEISNNLRTLESQAKKAEKYHSIKNEYKDVVMIGADCFELTQNHIEQAFDALKAGNDFVIGPAFDGGYYLIGMKKWNRWILESKSWSTSTLFEETKN